jgi:hypothetical protein
VTDETPRHEAVRRLGGARHWGTYRSWRWLPGHKLNKLSIACHGDTATIRGIKYTFIKLGGTSTRAGWVQAK